MEGHYHALFSQIRQGADPTSSSQSIGVISCSSGEGGSTIAANLAVWAARHGGGQVLLVDTDVSNPTFDQSFKVEPSPGWADVLSGQSELFACVQRSPVEKLSIMAAGTRNCSGPAQCQQARFSDLLGALKQGFGLIVVDLSAATDLLGNFRLAGTLDGVVLVIEAERTPIPVAQRVKQKLVRANVNLLGVAFNKQIGRPRGWLSRKR